MKDIIPLGFLKVFEKEGHSRKKLAEEGPYRRIGLVNGSFMGSHCLFALNLAGKTDCPVLVKECEKRGKELLTASVRVCSRKIQITRGDFAGYPIQIAHFTEYYPKGKKNKHVEVWIITTDLKPLPGRTP